MSELHERCALYSVRTLGRTTRGIRDLLREERIRRRPSASPKRKRPNKDIQFEVSETFENSLVADSVLHDPRWSDKMAYVGLTVQRS